MSDDSSASERDKQLLKETLALIARHDGDYRPASYAVWYAFADGQTPELRSAVQQAIDADGRLPDDVGQDLYRRYMANAAERGMMQARARLSETLAQARQDMGSAGAETQRFNDAVGAFGRKLERPSDIADLREEVARIADTTNRLTGSLSEMGDKLRSSREQVEQLSAELARTQQEALTDALSGLANRRAFEIALGRLLQSVQEPACASTTQTNQQAVADVTPPPDSPPSMLMLDIDQFKSINDRYGHPFGDQVIQGIAAVIRAQVKGRDVAARYGGEEFAILLPETSLAGAVALAESIRRTIEASRIRRGAEQAPVEHVTISIGVAAHREGESGDAFVARADAALYEAKRRGRNRVVAAEGDDDEPG